MGGLEGFIFLIYLVGENKRRKKLDLEKYSNDCQPVRFVGGGGKVNVLRVVKHQMKLQNKKDIKSLTGRNGSIFIFMLLYLISSNFHKFSGLICHCLSLSLSLSLLIYL